MLDWKSYIKILICDDAPQFKDITPLLELCWIHEGRHYKKLNPLIASNQAKVDFFLKNFWGYYRKLLGIFFKNQGKTHWSQS